MKKTAHELIIGKLKEGDLRITPQRRAVIDAFIKLEKLHPGARLVHEEAKKKRPSLSLSTTYSILGELSRLGIIRQLQFDQMENRYEGNIEEHINLICEGCRRITDYQIPLHIDPREVAMQADFKITEARLEFYGYCSECSMSGEGKTDR